MAETLTFSRLKIDFGGNLVTDDPLVPLSIPLNLKQAIALAIGSGADSFNVCYMKELTLGATTAANLDLSGALTSPGGGPAVFAKVRAIIVYLHPGANMGPLLIGGHATAAFSTIFNLGGSTFNTAQPSLRLRNGASGGLFLLTGTDSTGYAVTATTADILALYNEGSATATYDIVILGA